MTWTNLAPLVTLALLIVVSVVLIVWHVRSRRRAKERRLNRDMRAWIKSRRFEEDYRWRG
jgi:Flp pilus assembly protein TadB